MSTKSVRPQNLKLALRADSGLAVGQFYPLAGSRNVLGRSIDVAIPVDDAKVSRNHAAIDLQNGFYLLADLGSTNGTFLNGERIEQAQFLSPGDEIRLGSATFIVELAEKAKTLATKQWREPTSIIFVGKAAASGEAKPKLPAKEKTGEIKAVVAASIHSDEGTVAVPSSVVSETAAPVGTSKSPTAIRNACPDRSTGPRARRMIPDLNDRGRHVGRWVLAVLVLSVTVAAIVMRA